MKTRNASVVDLKTHIGRYLALVRQGETIVVTSHRHPVARLTGFMPDAAKEVSMIPPERPVKDLNEIPPLHLSNAAEGMNLLLADRRR